MFERWRSQYQARDRPFNFWDTQNKNQIISLWTRKIGKFYKNLFSQKLSGQIYHFLHYLGYFFFNIKFGKYLS